MSTEFQQYRFARVEARHITRARLEAQFKNGVIDFGELEKAITAQLEADATKCIPWRRSEIERTGCRQGVYTAALEFYWEHWQKLRRVALDKYAQDKPAASSMEKTWWPGTELNR